MTTLTSETFDQLTEGTILRIPGRKTPVRVTKIVERKSHRYALTTSGRVRRGHSAGGCVTVWNDSGTVTWQPTIQQQCSRMDGIEILGLAA